MQDAEQVQGDEPTEPTPPAEGAGPATATGPAADNDLDWFEDVPEENVGAVLSLDEIAPYAGI